MLGLTNVTFEKDRPCAACQAGKQVESAHHSKNIMTTSRPMELLHMDLFGPVAYLSIGGSKYGLVIVDDFSRFTWVFFLQDKTETQGTLKRFLRRAQNEFELKVKKIRSDNGSEFKNLQVEEYLEEEGIKHEFSAPHTTAKRCGREEEQDAHRHGEDEAWRVQDARAVLVGSREHGLPRHKPGLPSSPPQEDFV
jgi:transposase InsO family protein